MKKIIIILIGILFAAGLAFANERGTTKEAQALVKKGIAYYK
jgi:hypothetical protein